MNFVTAFIVGFGVLTLLALGVDPIAYCSARLSTYLKEKLMRQ